MKPMTSPMAVRGALLACLVCIAVLRCAAETFEPTADVIHLGRVFDVEACDLNGDGWIDLLISDYLVGHGVRYGQIGRLLGEWVPTDVPANVRESGHGAALGDLNGDGPLDAFLIYNQYPERVLLNDGAGRWVDSGQEIAAGSLWGTTVSLADSDGDGDLDAFVTYYQHGVRLYVNDGAGQFTASDRTLGADFISVTPGDIDGDGDTDLVGRVDADTVCIAEGVDGDYLPRDRLVAPGCRRVLVLDANGDSRTDLLIVGNEGSSLWLGDVGGGFTRTEQLLGGAAKAAVGDVDGDGDEDLAIGATIWLNDGGGDFEIVQSFEVSLLTCVVLLDVDDDERPELLLGSIDPETGSGPLAVYWNLEN